MGKSTWNNWMGNISFTPKAVFRPTDLKEIQAVVKKAALERVSIRVAGTGHSWTPLVPTDGYLIETCNLDRVLSVDLEAGTITCESGIGLQALTEAAARHGLQIPSHPDATEVTIGGIVATGSIGSGIAWPPTSDAVVRFTMVRADGEIVELDDKDPDIHAARVHLGLLGVVYAMTIQCLPAVPMRCESSVVPMEDALANLPEILDDHFAVMMFWYPYTDKAWMKTWNQAPGERVNFGWWQRTTGMLSQYVTRKLLGGPTEYLLRYVPSLTPLLTKTALAATPRKTYIEDTSDAFHFEYVNPLLWDACYAVPVEASEGAWRALMRLIEDFRAVGRYPINMITTSRFTKASDTLLSPAYGRDSCFIEAITAKGTPGISEFYAAFEDVMMSQFDGRPHWAKVFYDIPRVRGVYDAPLAAFEEIRARWDPDAMFLNPFLCDVFGLGPRPIGPAGDERERGIN